MARRVALLLAALLAVSGCGPAPGAAKAGPTAPRKAALAGGEASPSPRPALAPGAWRLPAGVRTRVVAQSGTPTRLSGQVKLLSDHGAALISNNGGAVISNNGGGLISNNGAAFALAQAAPAAEASLVDAVVYLHDASGQALVDADGQPLAARSDGQGGYQLAAVLPAENLVLRVQLWNGGALAAILPKADAGPREMVIDTAATLGATYVLEQFVKGDQATFDKLPAAEAERLTRALSAARGQIDKTPAYQAAELVALLEALRAQAPAVDQSLSEIKALLLGQANLGGGRPATEVPLADPRTLLRLPDGAWRIGEGAVGRIRHVAPDGTLTTWLDAIQGEKIKANWFGLQDLRLGPDGAIYGVDTASARVRKLASDGTVAVVAGNGAPAPGPLAATALDSPLKPWALDVGPDGTLFVGEEYLNGRVPRVLAIAPDGTLRAPAPPPDAWLNRGVVSVVRATDGTLWALTRRPGGLWRLPAGAAAWSEVAQDLVVSNSGCMRLGPDGLPVVSEDEGGRVVRVGLDGNKTVLAGRGGPPRTAALGLPSGLLFEPDGRLLIADYGTGVIWALGADQTLTRIAGQALQGQPLADGAIAVNAPGGLGFDGQGRMVVSDSGSHTLRRWDGKALETIAGGALGFAGDGGAATAARFEMPTGLAVAGETIWVLDVGNHRLRKIAPDGTISTVAGHAGAQVPLVAGVPVAPEAYAMGRGMLLALGPDALPVWSDVYLNQIHRLRADGRVELVVGAGGDGDFAGDGGPPAQARLDTPLGVAYGPDGSLYFTDTANMRIRRVSPDGATLETFAGQDKVQTMMALGGDPLALGGTTRQTALLVLPGGLCVDKHGNVYVGELGTANLPLLTNLTKGFGDLPLDMLPPVAARVRKFAVDGTITTIAGPGGTFFTDPTAADGLLLPSGLAIDPAGRLVIMDAGANLIRFIPAGSH